MDEIGFQKHLKRSGRSPNAADRVIEIAKEYDVYLRGDRQRPGSGSTR